MAENVWKLIYEETAAQKAQNLIAAAFGADQDPSVLLAELEKVSIWLVEGDGDAIAQRVVYFVSALTMFGRMGLDAFATVIAQAKPSVEEPEPEDVRNIAFDLLSEYAAQLREHAND